MQTAMVTEVHTRFTNRWPGQAIFHQNQREYSDRLSLGAAEYTYFCPRFMQADCRLRELMGSPAKGPPRTLASRRKCLNFPSDE